MTYLIIIVASFVAGVLFEVLGMGTRIRTGMANAIRPKPSSRVEVPPPDVTKIKKVG